jgi:hypothetical protein
VHVFRYAFSPQQFDLTETFCTFCTIFFIFHCEWTHFWLKVFFVANQVQISCLMSWSSGFLIESSCRPTSLKINVWYSVSVQCGESFLFKDIFYSFLWLGENVDQRCCVRLDFWFHGDWRIKFECLICKLFTIGTCLVIY